jgi:hypothetical protein
VLLQAQTSWRTAVAGVVTVAALVAAASVEEEAFAAGLVAAAFTAAAPSLEAALTVAALAVALAMADFAVAFGAMAFAVIGSTIATSTIGSSSLAISAPRSFTIPIPITDTIPDIILTITGTILTINLFTKAALDTLTLWLGKSSSVWLVQAIIMARSMA